jgi:hypothetical protein
MVWPWDSVSAQLNWDMCASSLEVSVRLMKLDGSPFDYVPAWSSLGTGRSMRGVCLNIRRAAVERIFEVGERGESKKERSRGDDSIGN